MSRGREASRLTNDMGRAAERARAAPACLRRAQPLGALLFTVPWLIVHPAICAFTGVSNVWLGVHDVYRFASEVRDEIERARTENVLFAWQLTKLLTHSSPEETVAAPVSEPEPRADSSAALRILDTEVDATSKRRATSTETQVCAPGDDQVRSR